MKCTGCTLEQWCIPVINWTPGKQSGGGGSQFSPGWVLCCAYRLCDTVVKSMGPELRALF
jgi:hypothetical protein